MSSLALDLRHAIRALRQRPSFSLLVVVTLALGIGTNVGLFVYLTYLAVSTLDAPAPERIAWIQHPSRDWPPRGLSHLDGADLLDAIDDLIRHDASFRMFGASMATDEVSRFAWGSAVAGDYFSLFDARPALGRLLEPADDRPGAPRVMVLQHLFWQRHLGGDPDIVGQVVRIDGERAYTVVGIAPRGFQGAGLTSGIYVPLATADDVLRGVDDRQNRALRLLVRLAPGVTEAQLQAAADATARGLDEAHPEEEPRRFTVAPVQSVDLASDEPIAAGSRVMMVAVAVLLLLASANVANLMLARTLARRRELAVQAALGGGRWRIARRLLLEAAILASLGGGLGLVIADGLRRAIEYYLIQTVPIGMGGWAEGTHIIADPTLVGPFFALVTAGTALVASLLPMAHAVRLDLVSALKAGTDDGDGRLGARRLLVVAQVALSVVLLVAAGLLARDLWSLRAQPLGFDIEQRTLATVYVPGARNDDRDAERRMQRELLTAVRQLPGVEAAAWTHRAPPTYEMIGVDVELADGRSAPVRMNIVSDGFFDTLDLPILHGRDFSTNDRADTPRVAIADQTAARELWKGDAIGRRIRLPGTGGVIDEVEIVGVVAASRMERPGLPPRPTLFFPSEQRFRARSTLVVHTAGPLLGPLRELVRHHVPGGAIIDCEPLAEQVRRLTFENRLVADLGLGFGLLGLGLAVLGLFSVTSYGVARRTREIGVRLAIGATGADIRRLILGETGRLVAAGIVLGLAGSWAVSRLLRSQLVDIDIGDPLAYAGALGVLVVATFAAALLPARRAAALEPTRALREE